METIDVLAGINRLRGNAADVIRPRPARQALQKPHAHADAAIRRRYGSDAVHQMQTQ
ncbi:hypothetical protein [Rhizobium wuzhouense]|uniref:hypothetical protein n=1 Tax=Rhizobium wuzhouense TaxID=1986026 RepID=UPI001401F24E|nr:hypothetical protein [Rhizobium wuzhouense]